MNDDDTLLPQPPLVSAVRARNIARLYRGLADGLRREAMTREANAAERDSQWWLTYALSLSQTPPGAVDPN